MVNQRKQPTAPLIELQQCSLVLDDRCVLDRVNFQLCAGQRWALIGGNGSGKTLLLRLLRGELWPTPTDAGDERRDTELEREQIAYVGPERQDKYIRHD